MPQNSPLSRRALLASCLLAAGSIAPAWAQSAPPGAATPDTDSSMDNPSGDASSGVSIELGTRPALVLTGMADWDDGLRAILDATDKVRAEMAKAGLQPGGRPIAVFTATDDRGFHYDAMIPLIAAPPEAQKLEFANGVKLGATPAGKAMKFEHRGSYDDIDSTYEAITAYLDEKGLESQNLFVEEYLSTPKSVDDQDMEVDIYVFIK